MVAGGMRGNAGDLVPQTQNSIRGTSCLECSHFLKILTLEIGTAAG